MVALALHGGGPPVRQVFWAPMAATVPISGSSNFTTGVCYVFVLLCFVTCCYVSVVLCLLCFVVVMLCFVVLLLCFMVCYVVMLMLCYVC